MKIADVIGTLKTFLEGLTWTSGDGGGTSGFEAVFTVENYTHDAGYPYVFIMDTALGGESLDNCTHEAETEVVVSVCVNWSVVDGQDDDAKREEAALRIREASDVLKEQLFTDSLRSTLGIDFVYNPNYGEIELLEEFNVYKRDFIMTIKEQIARK